ncbi:DUF4253 domain-containing protein [Saccharothrix isguenensis]
MIHEPPLPTDLAGLFTEGDATGRSLSVSLPPGRAVVSDEGDGDGPAFWLSDRPAPPGLWARLRAEHGRSGLWPLLLRALDDDEDFRPWGNGEVLPDKMSSPDQHDPAVLLSSWWDSHTGVDDNDMLSSAARLAVTAPYGRRWPGLTSPPAVRTTPDRASDDLAEELLTACGSMRLGLVAAGCGADAVTAAGWTGPANHTGDTAEISAVLRDWEHRFGVRVVGVGFATLFLSVAAPPATREEALAVAAEHFAFCPDNIWQGRQPGTLAAYAERLVGDGSWSFWWD